MSTPANKYNHYIVAIGASAGGLVIVQDPSTAKFDGMPNSVIAAGNADRFLKTVFDLIRGESGVEFNYYKTPTILRRINEEKFAENVFKLFQRLHPKDRFEGTGIGLAITKKIIERHDGLITVHSNQGQGARFDFVLPATH
jgi:hypothetical protein